MTEQEYEKLVRAVSNKYMADVFPCNPVAPASFEAGNKWTRENPPPEVQELVDKTKTLVVFIEGLYADGPESFDRAKYIQTIRESRIALERLKERTAGKGEG